MATPGFGILVKDSILSPSTEAQKRRSVLLVVIFTVLSAAAQTFIKTGANRLINDLTLVAIVTDAPLIAGLALYGIGAVLMVLALRHGQLSILWPIISLSYVWVAVLSVVIFHESMNAMRIAGICVIMLGVAILGRGSAA
jgi:drug/metabolite transporter (DMT)-like permease